MTKFDCTANNHLTCAGSIPIFDSLNKRELKQIVPLFVQKQYGKNELVISEGSILQDFIIVCKGSLKVFGYSNDGKEQIMYILTKGDFLGARNLIQDAKVNFNAQAIEDLVVCTMDRCQFQKLLVRFPGISLKIINVLCDRLEKMESMFRKISPKDVDSRVNMILLELSRKFGKKQDRGMLVELPMSREEMANYIGVARETVSRKLMSLKDEGVIEVISNKKILILKEEALES